MPVLCMHQLQLSPLVGYVQGMVFGQGMVQVVQLVHKRAPVQAQGLEVKG